MHNKYYNYIIYHKQCYDGFTGLFIAYLAKVIDKKTNIYPDVPFATNTPPDIKNKDVLIVDVAYKIHILKDIIDNAKSVTFIDHHVSIRDDVMQFVKNDTKDNKKYVKIIYNEKRCGASLIWKFLFPKTKIPLFIKYVEDNDTGAWKYSKTKPFIFSLGSDYNMTPTFNNLRTWRSLLDKIIVEKMCREGFIIKKYHDSLVDSNSKKYSMELFPSQQIFKQFPNYFNKVGQYRVAVFCGMDCPSPTELGNRILDTVDCDFVAMWALNMDRKEFVVSLRSRNIDIGSIAKLFGGGGHKLAGAFSISSETYSITDLFEGNSLPRSAK